MVFPPPDGPLIMTNSPLNSAHISQNQQKYLLLDWVELGVWTERDTLKSHNLLVSSLQVVGLGQVGERDDICLAFKVLGWQSVQVKLSLLLLDLLLVVNVDHPYLLSRLNYNY